MRSNKLKDRFKNLLSWEDARAHLVFPGDPVFLGDVTINGDLGVLGNTVEFLTSILRVEDRHIELAYSLAPSDVDADGGGIILRGDTDKSILWMNADNAWKVDQHWDVIDGNRLGAVSVGTKTLSLVHDDTRGVISSDDGEIRIWADASAAVRIGEGAGNETGQLIVEGFGTGLSRLDGQIGGGAAWTLVANPVIDQLLLALDASSGNQLVIGMQDDIAEDHGHAAGVDPALYLHGATGLFNPATWVGLSYSSVAGSALLQTGSGGIVLDPADQTVSLGDGTDAAPVVLFQAAAAGVHESRWQIAGSPRLGLRVSNLAAQPSQALLGVQSDAAYGHQLILTSYANLARNHDHAAALVDPTLFIHSVTNPDVDNTQWGSFSYDSAGDIFDIVSGGPALNFSLAGAADILLLTTGGPMVSDSVSMILGSGGDAQFRWSVADGDANALILGLPQGDVTNVPVLAVGDTGAPSVLVADLGLFDGITAPTVATVSADNAAWMGISHDAAGGFLRSSLGAINLDSASGIVNVLASDDDVAFILSASPTRSELSQNALNGAPGYMLAVDSALGSPPGSGQVLLALSSATPGGRQLIIGDYASRAKNFDHAAPANPTLFLHSVTDPDVDNTQWGSLSHIAASDEFQMATGGGVMRFLLNTSTSIFLATVAGLQVMDDLAFVAGNSTDAELLWETADGNANELILALPAQVGVNVPVFAIGNKAAPTIVNAPLGFFTGTTHPTLAMISTSNAGYLSFHHDGTDGVIRTNLGDIYPQPASGFVRGMRRVIATTVNYNSASPVTLATVQDGDIVTGIWAEVTTIWDGNGTVDIGDGSDTDGYLPNMTLNKGALGYKGHDHDTRGVYLWDFIGVHDRDHVRTGAGSITATVVTGTSTQGSMVVYLEMLRLK